MAAANNEFFEALSMLEHERGITAEYLIDKIKAAIIIAVKKNYEVEDDHVMVEIDPETGKFNVALIQDVVADEDWYDEHSEIGITEAQHIRKSYQVGDRVVTPLKTKDFGRIAAQTAKHVIRQGIREAERSQQLSEIQSRAHDIVQATVTRVDPEKGIVALDLGKGGEAILPRNEQVPGETYTEGQTLQVYVVDVVSTERGPRVMISRFGRPLVQTLLELLAQNKDGEIRYSRSDILQYLQARKLRCSTTMLRAILSELEGQGMVLAGKTRQGTRLSASGQRYLDALHAEE